MGIQPKVSKRLREMDLLQLENSQISVGTLMVLTITNMLAPAFTHLITLQVTFLLDIQKVILEQIMIPYLLEEQLIALNGE